MPHDTALIATLAVGFALAFACGRDERAWLDRARLLVVAAPDAYQAQGAP